MVREQRRLKLVRCLEVPSAGLEDIAAVLHAHLRLHRRQSRPRARRGCILCGFGAQTEEARAPLPRQSWTWKWNRCVRRWDVPGENNAGLLGYLRSIARNN